MPEWTRSQLIVYGALAAAILLLGARWIRSSEEPSRADPLAFEPQPAAADADGSFETGAGDVVVHVAGAVADPGVYRLPGNSRVADALERAGGPTRAAAPDAVNLAARLADGQQVVLPAKAGASSSGTTATAAGEDAPISIGTATVEQLDTIEGIGPVIAADIIEFRDANGGVASVEDLDEIPGIGPATMESLRASLQP